LALKRLKRPMRRTRTSFCFSVANFLQKVDEAIPARPMALGE
jgi:hypothetical protein